MSKKIAQSEHDEYASAGGFIAPAAIGPVYADSLAAANSFRQYQWYLDGRLTVGGNVNGANVDLISTEYTGAGVKVGIIDQGFDIHNIDLAGRFDLGLSFDPPGHHRRHQHCARQRGRSPRHLGVRRARRIGL